MTSQAATATTTINPTATTTTSSNNGKLVAATSPSMKSVAASSNAHAHVSTSGHATKGKSIKRLELERHIREFQSKLGNDWEKYHETLSLFLIGKLSRPELIKVITPLLKNGLLKYHNKLLLLNFANSLRDGPLDFLNEFASFWNKKAGKATKVKSTQYEKFKQNIMGLPIKERRRIKNITRDSGKRGKLNAGITLTRHTLLPKIPMIQDKEQQQLQVNNLVQWQQDVVNGINTPIATENYEIPDYDNLSRRVLMTMREYGLTGGLNAGVLEVLSLGLESHLKNIMESAIDVAKYRKNKYTNTDYIPIESSDRLTTSTNVRKRPFDDDDEPQSTNDITLSVEDLYDTLEMFPHLVEPGGPKYRLSTVMLDNDDYIADGLDYDLPPKLDTFNFLSVSSSSNPANPINSDSKGTASSHRHGNMSPGDSSTNLNGSANALNGSIANDLIKKENNENTISNPLALSPTVESRMPRPDAHIGTTDELKWMLHDLVSTM